MKQSVGIAGPSEIAARAGAAVAAAGGNAVDAAVAATLAALCTEVAIVAPDAGAYVTVWAPGEQPVVIDGGIAMPGLGRPAARFGAGGRAVELGYGGGLHTVVGFGAVGVGGAIAALGEAATGWSRLEWPALVAPALAHAREGFPLSQASHTWLRYSHAEIFGWQPESAAVIHDERGALLEPGSRVRVPGLAESLAELARDGPAAFYAGPIGRHIAECVDAGGGLMGLEDRCIYRAERQTPMVCEVDGWRIAAPPPPAIGGVVLASILDGLGDQPRQGWTPAAVAAVARAQREVFEFLEAAASQGNAGARLAERLGWAHGRGGGRRSPSTVHVSAVDEAGLACAITASSGYGSGVLVPGAGIWLNNCLGEVELNPRGFHALAPGERMSSNMSPAVARHPDGRVLSLGSPGAERITTALAQVLLNFLRVGATLEEALAAPRLHVERGPEGWRLAAEPGLPLEAVEMPVRLFDGLSMFFGGAGAVLHRPDGELVAAADPRRQGAAQVVRRAEQA
jgi:gamma-glutamyltranspeptidase / glutathione hydrolase